ncbi:hypothetical protein M885DRAFT_499616 [Pelagophyceae sp. CCMP2097]|nr:hypothetical protein M885DRAFT_499616 [Pelagophyceae sp. CCMP2097]
MDRDKFTEVAVETGERRKEEVFVEWLLDNGAQFSECVELRAYDDEVRGVHATRDIGEDEVVIQVPLKCLVTVEMGKETAPGRAVLDAELDLDAPKHVFLMLFLLVDRKDPASFFSPYYDMLPATLSNMPVFWNQEELNALQGSPLLAQIDERRKAIKADYAAICGAWAPFAGLATLEEFMWARMCGFPLFRPLFRPLFPTHNLGPLTKVPYADMLNHYRPRETKWAFDNARRAFTITALQGIGSGAQIYDSYGQKCNHRFLLNYGFSVERNVEPDGFCPNEVVLTMGPWGRILGSRFWSQPSRLDGKANMRRSLGHDIGTVLGDWPWALYAAVPLHGRSFLRSIRRPRSLRPEETDPCLPPRLLEKGTGADPTDMWRLRLALRDDDSLAARKRLLWLRDGNSTAEKRLRICAADNEAWRAALSLLRVLVADEEDLEHVLGQNPYGSYRTASDVHFPVSLRNECDALEALQGLCAGMLKRYATTLEEDAEVLASSALPAFSNLRHAKIHVHAEKMVIHHYLDLSRTALEMAALPNALGVHLWQGLEEGLEHRARLCLCRRPRPRGGHGKAKEPPSGSTEAYRGQQTLWRGPVSRAPVSTVH